MANEAHNGGNGSTRSDRYLVVSGDSHAGPSLERQLRPYCPPKHLEEFDAFARGMQRAKEGSGSEGSELQSELGAGIEDPGARTRSLIESLKGLADKDTLTARAIDLAYTCPGQQDPDARIADMDDEGIAADVIFAGGQNWEVLPFLARGTDHGPQHISSELRAVGSHIWNQWLVDFCSVQPERHVGVMQLALSDVDGAVSEMRWAREAGLKAVNLPAPQREMPPYNDPVYEPLWSACEDLDLPMLTHVGGGDLPMGLNARNGRPLRFAEQFFFGRRGLWQLIFGGVFERHPKLKLVFTEQRVGWVTETLNDLESVYDAYWGEDIRGEIRRPKEYWSENCYICASFMAPYEVELREQVGVGNLIWGSDYPHVEGTWPRTRLSLRNTFARVPVDETSMILGGNAVEVFGLDEQALRKVSDRIGPTRAELSQPLREDEFPPFRGFAFRESGICS